MHRRLSTWLVLLLALAIPHKPLRAELSLAPLFTDHAVLQSGRPVPIWGRADPGARVSINYCDRTCETRAGDDGRWLAVLNAMPPNLTGTLTVTSGKLITLADVVTGEVWLCSGQSNMAMAVRDAEAATEEIAHATFPQIRQFRVALAPADSPREQAKGTWVPASPLSVGTFTAAGYFFARHLHGVLKVPVGIINSSKGGTPIEAWMSAEALATKDEFSVVDERWAKAAREFATKDTDFRLRVMPAWNEAVAQAKTSGQALPPQPVEPPGGPADFRAPMRLFNGMIYPLRPYSIRGILWYQGEANAARSDEYPALVEAMLNDWRHRWDAPDLPFLFVQLPNLKIANNPDGEMWVRMRAAQEKLTTVRAVEMVVTYDIGDPDNVHPKNKQEVGRLLALLALGRVYGHALSYSGPTFESARIERSGVRLSFRHADGGLMLKNGLGLGGFEISTDGRTFAPAPARIEGDQVVLTGDLDHPPVAARYAWTNNPIAANLFNRAGLPARPFLARLEPRSSAGAP